MMGRRPIFQAYADLRPYTRRKNDRPTFRYLRLMRPKFDLASKPAVVRRDVTNRQRRDPPLVVSHEDTYSVQCLQRTIL
jgi:hypothetical protein